MAVGTCTLTEEVYGSIKKVVFSWVAGTGGEAGTVTKQTLKDYNGAIERLVTVPGGAPNAPTTLYDVTVTDEDGNDVLMGTGVDRSATATEQVLGGSLGVVANGKLTLNIANAGSGKAGQVFVYLR